MSSYFWLLGAGLLWGWQVSAFVTAVVNSEELVSRSIFLGLATAILIEVSIDRARKLR